MMWDWEIWDVLQVRIYTADKVHFQLQDAFHDYIQAAVGMSTKGKLLVPKLLQCYAREFVEDNALLAWICDLLPNSQVAMICEYVQQRHRHHRILGSRNFTIIPFDFTFRYLFPADIARELMSIWKSILALKNKKKAFKFST